MKDLDTSLFGPQAELLVRALLAVEDRDGCYRLLKDLCTVHEVEAMAQRLEVARMLRRSVTYQEIASQTNTSTATISRVNRCLLYGSDGYTQVLDKLDAEDEGDKSWT
ncbi:MAG: hypothetical protein LBU67_02600 [Oscillospiraceae bacterium]|jgi:TrpR-related protein YerC/YecD|nr:hypothetical protein [Oscillospiraceae bacterium]